jgi:hypothetical protein
MEIFPRNMVGHNPGKKTAINSSILTEVLIQKMLIIVPVSNLFNLISLFVL